MHLSVARAILLCAGAVSALLQNVTVDDTSPEIVYEGLTFQCNAADGAALCGPEASVGLFNQSATFTSGRIMFNFTGVAYYATFDIFGVASVILDGVLVKALNNSDLTATNLTENVFGTGLANVPHALVINPASSTTVTVLGLDRLVYTAILPDKKKTHVGAIVGGVMAGLAVILGLLLTTLFARRRKLILRRNQRKTAVLNGMAVARRNHVHAGGGDDDAKELPITLSVQRSTFKAFKVQRCRHHVHLQAVQMPLDELHNLINHILPVRGLMKQLVAPVLFCAPVHADENDIGQTRSALYHTRP